jgi:cell division inhibitor SepF
MAMDKLKKFFIVPEDEEIESNYEEDVVLMEDTKRSSKSLQEISHDDSQVILMEPRAYSESQSIANHIKADKSVIVNLHRVTPEQARRIIDFLTGTVYALEGSIEKLGGKIILCAPKSVNVAGEISESVNK